MNILDLLDISKDLEESSRMQVNFFTDHISCFWEFQHKTVYNIVSHLVPRYAVILDSEANLNMNSRTKLGYANPVLYAL